MLISNLQTNFQQFAQCIGQSFFFFYQDTLTLVLRNPIFLSNAELTWMSNMNYISIILKCVTHFQPKKILHCIIDLSMNYHTDTIYTKIVSITHKQFLISYWLSARLWRKFSNNVHINMHLASSSLFLSFWGWGVREDQIWDWKVERLSSCQLQDKFDKFQLNLKCQNLDNNF